MNSFSDTILTRPHIRPSLTTTPTLKTHSRKTSNTLINYAPLSTSSSSSSGTLIDYAPLPSTTSPAFTSHPSTSTAPTSIAPSSSRTADSDLSATPDSQATFTPIGFTVVVLILLGLMLAMATTMWFAESRGRQTSLRSECQKRKILEKAIAIANAEPVGLGITLHPDDEERKEIGGRGRLKGRFSAIIEKAESARMIARWTNFAVSRAQTDLDMNAEEGLLLPVRESERLWSENNRIDNELDLDRGC